MILQFAVINTVYIIVIIIIIITIIIIIIIIIIVNIKIFINIFQANCYSQVKSRKKNY